MGVVIPLFNRDFPEDLELTREEKVRLSLLQNSLNALKREEEFIEKLITEKCKDEINQLKIIGAKIQNIEIEMERIRQCARKKPLLS